MIKKKGEEDEIKSCYRMILQTLRPCGIFKHGKCNNRLAAIIIFAVHLPRIVDPFIIPHFYI
jgi:hypothetical protein